MGIIGGIKLKRQDLNKTTKINKSIINILDLESSRLWSTIPAPICLYQILNSEIPETVHHAPLLAPIQSNSCVFVTLPW